MLRPNSYAEDGKTPVGYDVDMSKAIAQTLGLKPKIVSSMFDTIVPSIGSKYDLGITAMHHHRRASASPSTS